MITVQPRSPMLGDAEAFDKRFSRGLAFIAFLGVAALGLGIVNTVSRVRDRKSQRKQLSGDEAVTISRGEILHRHRPSSWSYTVNVDGKEYTGDGVGWARRLARAKGGGRPVIELWKQKK